MTLKVYLFTTVIALLPAFATAGPGCSSESHAGRCADGQMMNPQTGECADKTTS